MADGKLVSSAAKESSSSIIIAIVAVLFLENFTVIFFKFFLLLKNFWRTLLAIQALAYKILKISMLRSCIFPSFEDISAARYFTKSTGTMSPNH
jgi:hypothetical protein